MVKDITMIQVQVRKQGMDDRLVTSLCSKTKSNDGKMTNCV